MDELTEALYRLNPTLPDDAISDALFKLQNFENGELVQKNAVFMDYLQNGIEVRYTNKGEERSAICYLVDYANTDNNSFIVANQWTFVENDEKRPDVLLFINGLPVVLMELKSPSREETDASEAYTQIRNYMHSIPSMFIYNAICVMSDLSENRAGTITSGEDRYMEWKRIPNLLNLTHSLRISSQQKFEESGEPLSERRNIVVMADEAHRGQYGLTEKIKMSKMRTES